MPSRDSRQSSSAIWPVEGLDVPSLLRDGWAPRPFRQFIVKLNGRCNLACTYCYVYEMGDESWRSKPKIISAETLDCTARRIAEHATAHQLADVEVVLHGGEPLLYGVSFIDDAVGRLRDALPTAIGLSIRLQTNGTLLTKAVLDTLLDTWCQGRELVSTVRPAPTTHDGCMQMVAVVTTRSLRRCGCLRRNPMRACFPGVLCTIDVTADPVRTYEALAAFSPPQIDFLLPHANWQIGLLLGTGNGWRLPSTAGMTVPRPESGCSRRSFGCCWAGKVQAR